MWASGTSTCAVGAKLYKCGTGCVSSNNVVPSHRFHFSPHLPGGPVHGAASITFPGADQVRHDRPVLQQGALAVSTADPA